MIILAIALTYFSLMFLALSWFQIVRRANDMYKGKDVTDQRAIISISVLMFAILAVLAVLAWGRI